MTTSKTVAHDRRRAHPPGAGFPCPRNELDGRANVFSLWAAHSRQNVLYRHRRRHTAPMCCRGCQAVAQTIIDGGTGDYYKYRTASTATARELVPEFLQAASVYDHPDVQKSFVRAEGEHGRETTLILEGITCAACLWLNESHLARLPGVLGTTTRRCWRVPRFQSRSTARHRCGNRRTGRWAAVLSSRRRPILLLLSPQLTRLTDAVRAARYA